VAWRPETVYLGGGTPSNLDPEELRKLLELIPGRPWAEVPSKRRGNITRRRPARGKPWESTA